MTTATSLGSPFANLLGLVIDKWDTAEVRLRLPNRPETRNVAGAVHGGAIATLIDMAGSMAGCYSDDPQTRRRVVTLNLSVNFVGPAGDGPVFAEGRRRGGGKTVYMSTVEVTDVDGRVVATGHGTFKFVADSAHRKRAAG